MKDFITFPKMARWSRDIVITEKIDGTNACVYIGDDGEFLTGSRTRWITPQDDNFGFSRWAHEHQEDLMRLGPGRHFGEWWGQGIQRGYGLQGKRFSLFNTHKWNDAAIRPACCHIVPVLYSGALNHDAIHNALDELKSYGSLAAPTFNDPEGIIIYHTAAGIGFKKTIEHDETYKGKQNERRNT